MRFLSAFPNLQLLDTDGFDATNWEKVAHLCPKIQYISTGTVSVDTDSLSAALRLWKPLGLMMPWFSYEFEKIGQEIGALPLQLLLLPRYQITQPDSLTRTFTQEAFSGFAPDHMFLLLDMSSLTMVKIIYNSWVAAPLTLHLTLPHLAHLDMSGCADEVDLIARCPKLKCVSFNRCRFRNVLLETSELALLDLSCVEMSASLYDLLLSTGLFQVRSVDLRGFQLVSPDSSPTASEIPVRDILDGRSALQAELTLARMSSCSPDAVLRLCECTGASLSDLYLPLSILTNAIFAQILSCCPKLDRLLVSPSSHILQVPVLLLTLSFSDDFTDIGIDGLDKRGGVEALRRGKFPPDAMPVSERFLEILSDQRKNAFVHLYCSYESTLAAPLIYERTPLPDLTALEFAECDFPRPDQLAEAMAALPSLKNVQFQICKMMGAQNDLVLSGSRLQLVTLSQVRMRGLDLSGAPQITKLEIYRCTVAPEEALPLLRFAPETLGTESKLRSFSMRRMEFDQETSAAEKTRVKYEILRCTVAFPKVSSIRLDFSTIPSDSCVIGSYQV